MEQRTPQLHGKDSRKEEAQRGALPKGLPFHSETSEDTGGRPSRCTSGFLVKQ